MEAVRRFMNKQKLYFTIGGFIISAVFVISLLCFQASKSEDVHNIKNHSNTSQIINAYWETAMTNSRNNIENYICDYPSKFFEIDSRVKKYANIKHMQNNETGNTNLSIKDNPSESLFILKDYWPTIIRSHNLHIVRIYDEWTTGNEARVRVVIGSEQKNVLRDILLFNQSGEWKIFRICLPGEDIFYAS